MWDLADRLLAFHQRYRHFFQLQTRTVIEQARQYLSGLMQATKRNMERMAEVVPDTDEQSLQNFLSYSPWDERALMDQIAIDANRVIGGTENTCLIVDETAISKKGSNSVGVARQWNGRLGKVDNCQVAVFSALCRDARTTLIDTRLFLPESWTNDKQRCLRAGVPEDRLEYYKKTALALEMVHSARALGLDFQWVGGDAFYGHDSQFIRELDQERELFMLDVHSDQTIYLEDPAPHIPERKSRRGRAPVRLVTDQPGLSVQQWANGQPESAWQRLVLRESTRGPLTVRVLHRHVWLWDGKEPQAHRYHLIVSETDRSKRKYSVSNAPAKTPTQRLAFMQAQRYWVERAIEDAKSHAGLADYQVRTWTGWHHHIAMVMLALLFMLEIRLEYEEDLQLLSCRDIQELLSHFLPRRDVTRQEVIQQMLNRHKKRAASIEYHYRKYKLKTKG